LTTTRYASDIRIERKDLHARESIIKDMISPILAENYLTWKLPRASSYSFKIDLRNGVGHRLQTPLEDFKVEYFELWKATGSGTGDNELWNLDKAYFALLKKNNEREDYDEFLALHCEAGFLPERTPGIILEENDEGYQKQKYQQKYQRLIHLHMVFLSQYAEEKDCPKHSFLSVNSCLAKSHIGVTLGRNKFEFDSVESMSEAMRQAIQLISDEILNVLAEN
jgi:hypothetical protein